MKRASFPNLLCPIRIRRNSEAVKAASRITNLDAYPDEYIRHPEWGVKYANLVSDVSNLPFTQDAMAIASTSKNPERALMLYDLITSDQEVFNAFYYGVEGVNYKIIDGQIENLAPDDFVYSACWSARTPEFDMDDYGSPADLPDIRASFDSHIEEMKGEGSQKYTGFVMDTAAIETEFAACQNVHQQYWWPLELAYTDAESGLQEYEEKDGGCRYRKDTGGSTAPVGRVPGFAEREIITVSWGAQGEFFCAPFLSIKGECSRTKCIKIEIIHF